MWKVDIMGSGIGIELSHLDECRQLIGNIPQYLLPLERMYYEERVRIRERDTNLKTTSFFKFLISPSSSLLPNSRDSGPGQSTIVSSRTREPR